MEIRPYRPDQLEDVVELSLRAWAPVFDSLHAVLRPEVYAQFYPDGWEAAQRKTVEDACIDTEIASFVAIVEENGTDEIAGYVSIKLNADDKMGEIYLVAVDPVLQGRGIGTALSEFALNWMKEQGMEIAMVETGGDPGHAPARRSYEKAGFHLLPIARYFKKL